MARRMCVILICACLAASVANAAPPMSSLRPTHEHEIMGVELFHSITPTETLTAEVLPLNFTEHMHFDGTNEEIVDKMDSNSDGEVDKEEFLQFVDPKLAKIWALEEFKDQDRDNSTTLDRDEWVGCAQHTMQVDTRDDGKVSFDKVDASKDGSISLDEYVAIALDLFTFVSGDMEMGAPDPKATISKEAFMAYSKHERASHWSQSVDDLFMYADTNQDGQLSRTEFFRIAERGVNGQAHKGGEL